MIPELGLFFLILALCFGFILSVVPIAGSYYERDSWMRQASVMAYGQFLFVLSAFFV